MTRIANAVQRGCCGALVGAVCGASLEAILWPLLAFLTRPIFHFSELFAFPIEGLIFGGLVGSVIWTKRVVIRRAVIGSVVAYLALMCLPTLTICAISHRPLSMYFKVLLFMCIPNALLQGALTGLVVGRIYSLVAEHINTASISSSKLDHKPRRPGRRYQL